MRNEILEQWRDSVQSIDARIEITGPASGGTGQSDTPELRGLDNPPQDETNSETVPQAKIERMGNGEDFFEFGETPRSAKGEPPPAAKPDLRNDPYYQEQLTQLQNLRQSLSGWTAAKREFRRQQGRIVVEIEQHFEGSTYGERVVGALSEDLRTGSSVLYDARSFWNIDPGEESQFSLFGENVCWDWVRVMVRMIKTPEELTNFLANNPGLAEGSREEFSKALLDWYNRYHQIEEEDDEEEDDDEGGGEGDGDNEDISGGDTGDSTSGSTGQGAPTRKRSKDYTRDYDVHPDLITEMLAAFQLEDPQLAAKVELTAEGDEFDLALSRLVSVAECRDICVFIAAKLSELLDSEK